MRAHSIAKSRKFELLGSSRLKERGPPSFVLLLGCLVWFGLLCFVCDLLNKFKMETGDQTQAIVDAALSDALKAAAAGAGGDSSSSSSSSSAAASGNQENGLFSEEADDEAPASSENRGQAGSYQARLSKLQNKYVDNAAAESDGEGGDVSDSGSESGSGSGSGSGSDSGSSSSDGSDTDSDSNTDTDSGSDSGSGSGE